MTKTELAYLPAYKSLEMFKAKTLSPVEHIEALIDRASAVEPKVNAFTNTYFDEAMDKARLAEKKYAAGKPTRKLEGLGIGIKDESEIRGLPTTNGSLAMKDYVATHTSPVNERILRAGGIVHARTATPEFSCTVTTNSKLWGITRNPWNPELSPGGSSGGSSASLASGTSALCSGSDIGGSIRIPASTCGLYGLKPTFGRNPADSPFNLDQYAVDGPLARTAKDMILLQNVMCGPHKDDMVSLRPKLSISSKLQPIKGWKIAYSPNLGFYEISDDVRRNTEEALDTFRDAGAVVEQVDIGWTEDILAGAMQHLEHLFGGSLAELVNENPKTFMPYTRALVDGATTSNAAKFLEAGEIANRMYSELSKVFAKYRLLICPTTALPSVPADSDGVSTQIFINGQRVHPLHGWILTVPFNMLCRCPVVSAPSGFGQSGVPTGIQIVGHTYRDQDVCRAALAYEAVRGEGFASPEKIPKMR
ncbi:amidase [Primorskyibacter sp. S87]|uniref:amidase n=1 Tax=Primorskyibacter sp. S87 TaxID=3415126 RepID=UPI003C7D698F